MPAAPRPTSWPAGSESERGGGPATSAATRSPAATSADRLQPTQNSSRVGSRWSRRERPRRGRMSRRSASSGRHWAARSSRCRPRNMIRSWRPPAMCRTSSPPRSPQAPPMATVTSPRAAGGIPPASHRAIRNCGPRSCLTTRPGWPAASRRWRDSPEAGDRRRLVALLSKAKDKRDALEG